MAIPTASCRSSARCCRTRWAKISRGTNLGEPDYNTYERKQYGIGYDLAHEFSSALTFHSNSKYSHYKEEQKVIYGGGGLGADNRTVVPLQLPVSTRRSRASPPTIASTSRSARAAPSTRFWRASITAMS